MSINKPAALLGSLAVLLALGAAFVISGYGTSKAKGLWLEQRSTADIQNIEITDHENGRTLELTLEDEAWLINHEGSSMLSEKVSPLLAALAYLKAEYKVEMPDNLEQYGLTSPRTTIAVSYHNLDRRIWELGSALSDRRLYLREEGQNTVYLIDKLRSDVIGTAAENFLEIPLNQVDFSRIVGLQIKSPIQGEIRMERSESPRSEGDFFWRIFAPYSGNARKDRIEKIIAAIANEPRARKVDDLTAAAIGEADKEITFYDSFDRQLSIQVGMPDGNQVLCRIEGLSGTYTVSDSILSAFEIDPESLADMTLYHYEPASVSELFFVLGTREHHFISVWEDTGGEKQRQRFIMDGQPISSADYYEFARSVAAVTGEKISSGGGLRLGDPLGRMDIRRISPPYEQEILFRGIHNEPTLAGVDYGGNTMVLVKIKNLEHLMDRVVQ